MIDELINTAVALVKGAWFAYPMENVKKENEERSSKEFVGGREEQKDARDPKEARDVFISNPIPLSDQQPQQQKEDSEQRQGALTDWLYRSLSLTAWKAETPSSLDTVQVDEYNWTKSDRDKREVMQSEKNSIDHSDIIVDEYNWKASSVDLDADPHQSGAIDKLELKQKIRGLDHSNVMYDEYNWTPSSTSALKDIRNKATSDEGWPSVYDHGNPKK